MAPSTSQGCSSTNNGVGALDSPVEAGRRRPDSTRSQEVEPQKSFYQESDYDEYIYLMAVISTEDEPARAVGEAHRRYSRMINFRKGWRGHLFQ